jgi:hypothetical protein
MPPVISSSKMSNVPTIIPMLPTCSCGCPDPCSYNSPPGLTHDWSLGRDLNTYPCRDICVGPCCCSDVYWDELLLEINTNSVLKYGIALQKSLGLARQGRGGNRLYPGPKDLELDTPFKTDLYDNVEEYHWLAHGCMLGIHPTAVQVRQLPPCLHRVYAHIDQIFVTWETDMAELFRLVDENQKRSLDEYQKATKEKAKEEKLQQRQGKSYNKKPRTGNIF